jgi:hypothetical protein
MARRKLSFEEQLKGVQAAIRSKKTPPQLRQGLGQRAEWLKKRIRETKPKQNRKRGLFF